MEIAHVVVGVVFAVADEQDKQDNLYHFVIFAVLELVVRYTIQYTVEKVKSFLPKINLDLSLKQMVQYSPSN